MLRANLQGSLTVAPGLPASIPNVCRRAIQTWRGWKMDSQA